jgi:hypothetical protein
MIGFEPKSKSESESTSKGSTKIEIKDDEMRRRMTRLDLRIAKTVRKKPGAAIW